MSTLQFIYDHVGAISGWLVATYHVVANAGGLRTIWSNFYGISAAQTSAGLEKPLPAVATVLQPSAETTKEK